MEKDFHFLLVAALAAFNYGGQAHRVYEMPIYDRRPTQFNSNGKMQTFTASFAVSLNVFLVSNFRNNIKCGRGKKNICDQRR